MAGNNSLDERLKAGIEAARRGDKPTAQKLLRQVVDITPNNEVAWMWLASALDNLTERKQALEQALRINPQNSRAQQALAQINSALGTTSPRRPGQPAPAPAARGGSNWLVTILGALLLLGLLVLVIFGVVNSTQQTTPPNRQTQAAVLNTAVPTATINPRDYTPTPFYGVLVTPQSYPTFPPTFTPTFTPTVLPPTATVTPIPQTFFSLLYTSLKAGEEQPSLFSVSGDGTGDQQIGSGVAGFSDVAYAPDQRQMLFIRTVTFDNQGASVTSPELFVGDVNNPGAAKQITQLGSDHQAHPWWAPDALRIVLVSNYDGDDELWTLTNDGKNLVQITTNDWADRDPAWSPNADVIAYASEQASGAGTALTEIFTITADGSTITQLTDANGSSYSPSWSPDGTMIVFASDRNGDGDIFIMDADGQNLRLLTNDATSTNAGAEDRSPAFTPDGNSILFVSNRADGVFQLYRTDLRGSKVERLGDPGLEIQSFSFRPEPLLAPE
ncbi:MAG: hypothetical protein R3E39_16625 [Anaerolineae bacterium]